jgi:PucR-like helix-turn-helix protein
MPGHNAAQRILADLAGRVDEDAGRQVPKSSSGVVGRLLNTDRLDKIQELLACSLDDAEARFQLQVAVRLHRLIEV